MAAMYGRIFQAAPWLLTSSVVPYTVKKELPLNENWTFSTVNALSDEFDKDQHKDPA